MPVAQHKKSILLVEDRAYVANTVQRWLTEAEYEVRVASSLSAAEHALEEQHFHLAIVDICLDEEDASNEDGMVFIERIEARGYGDVLSCIILTGHGTKDTAISVVAKPHVVGYVEKESGYRAELLASVRTHFERVSQINFDLEFEGDSEDLLHEVVHDVWWSGRPTPEPGRLIPETLDLFGSLYNRAKRVYLTRLRPGLSGAATVRIHPTWQFGLGPSHVTKISRKDKIAIEQKNFDYFVRPYLSANIITRVEAAYTQNLGAIQYTFAEDDDGPLHEFDEIYNNQATAQIVQCLHNVIFRTCINWYETRRRVIDNIPKLYYEAFNLSEDRLCVALRALLGSFDPARETIWLNRYQQEVTNPLWWLRRNSERCHLPVYKCITHGDLTGRNIMTRRDGSKSWLIDFYRTYDSHLLRDFVIFETDIKYRLLGEIEAERFAGVESALIDNSQELLDEATLDGTFLPREKKAVQAVQALRACAAKVSHPLNAKDTDDVQREFLLSLLMATLNVTRLRHITEERKIDALWSSASICNRVDALVVA